MIYAQASRSSQVLGDSLTTTIRQQATSGGRSDAGGPDQRPVLLTVEGGAMIEMLLGGQATSFQLVSTDSRDDAISLLRRHDPIVIAIDLDRGDVLQPSLDDLTAGKAILAVETPTAAGQAEAFRTMQDLMALSPATRFIALTAAGDREAALRAISMGVQDVFEKPLDAPAFQLIVERTFRMADIELEYQRRLDAANQSGIEGIVTRSPAMLKLCRQVLELAQTRETVLLQGEVGTGKHLLAQALHLNSARADHRFAVLRCTAKDHRRLHAELFGNERREKRDDETRHDSEREVAYPGKLELAHGGTMFLDEVSELPPELQRDLLQFLQDRSISRDGSNETMPLDVRVICSSRFDLNELAAAGRFNQELAYRLSGTHLKVPALRDRSGDAAMLAHAMLRRLGRRHGRNRLTLSEAALDAISTYSFPGNVQELESVLRRAIANVVGRILTPADLDLPHAQAPDMLNLRRIRDDAERQAVLRVMARSDGNVARAAELLGISRPTLYDLLNRFGLR